jgi:hypothetical protein
MPAKLGPRREGTYDESVWEQISEGDLNLELKYFENADSYRM